MFDYLFGSGSSDAAPSIATPPAIVNEIREQAPVMNERAAKRFAFYDSIDDYLDSDPRIRFELGGGKPWVEPAYVGIDAYSQIDSVKDE